jgi:hypothetical protein
MNKTALRDPTVMFMTYGGEMGVTYALGPLLGPGSIPNIQKYIWRIDHGLYLYVVSNHQIQFGTS